MTSEIPLLLLFILSAGLFWRWYQLGDVLGYERGKLRRFWLFMTALGLMWGCLGLLWIMSSIDFTFVDGGLLIKYESIATRLAQR